MASFKDGNNNEWIIALNIGSIKRVKTNIDIDLLYTDDAQETPLLLSLQDDPCELADILYHLIKPQADKKDVSYEAFLDAVDGDTIAGGYNALTDELVNFFQKKGDIAKAKSLKKVQFMVKTTLIALDKEVEKISDEDVAKQVEDSIGTLFTQRPESSE